MVLVFIAFILATIMTLGYSLSQTSWSAFIVQQNVESRQQARQCADAGILFALRKLHEATPPGEGSFQVAVSPSQSFQVTFSNGDPTGEASFLEDAMRKTATVTGTAGQAGQASSVILRMTVELIPRAVATPFADWDDMERYACIQADTSSPTIQGPVQFNGLTSIESPALLFPDYPRGESRPLFFQHLAYENHLIKDR